jgi:hypothetical protein
VELRLNAKYVKVLVAILDGGYAVKAGKLTSTAGI